MRFWVEIESAAGIKTGRIDNLLYWRNVPRLSKAGEIEFALPAADPKAALITNKVLAYCYTIVNGVVTQLGAGIVEELKTRMMGMNAPILVVKGGDLLRELAIHATIYGSFNAIITQENVNNVPSYLITTFATSATFPASWSLSGASTTTQTVYARFWHDTVLQGLIRVGQSVGEHFRLGSGRTVHWLGRSSGFGSSNILCTTVGDPAAVAANPSACLITKIEEVTESWDQWTRVFLFGAGEGEDRLDLQAVENWPDPEDDQTTGTSVMTFSADVARADNGVGTDQWECNRRDNYLENNTKRVAYGYLQKVLSIKDIAPISNTDADLADAADYLLQVGYNYLRTRVSPQKFYRLSVTGLENTIDVGETIIVYAQGVYQDADGYNTYFDVNRSDLIVIETTQEITERGIRTVDLLVATTDRFPETDESALLGPVQESIVMQALPQMGPSENTVSYAAPIDDDNGADLHFWLGDNTTTVNQVIMRFRVDPLRSTVKTVGGSASVEVDIDDPHSHMLHVVDDTVPGTARLVYIDITTTPKTLIADVSAVGQPTTLDVDTTTSDGDGTGVGSVDLSSAITTTYGIFEESGGNTYAYSDLEFLVNGSAASGSVAAISGATGWYELDLTDDVKNSDNRPVQAANYVTCQIKTASKASKTVRITAEIEKRTVIQSVATV